MRAFSSPSFGRRAQVCQPAPAIESSASHGGRGAMVSSEDAVKILTARIEDISSRLSVKDEMACQQSRLAKDAVEDLIKKDEQVKRLTLALKGEMSAKEKAEAAYRLSKLEFDKMCQQRSMADSRTIHLNVAFKESLEELKHAKTQLEQKTQEAYSDKKECEKLRNEVEAENRQLKVQLMEVTAESIAMSKSLQERARSLNEITETRAKVESESKILQVQLESLRKDVDAHKYEIHVLKKELQLRNEEKEQSKRIAEGTHKRHLENVKKLAKLDSECNRLRALVRKRLSGPVGLAQMRVEADLVGKKRIASPKQTPDQKEMEPLTDRLLAMEDETKLLKESLVKKTAELQAARQLCARTASKLSTAECMIEAVAKSQSVTAEEKMVAPSSLKEESTPQHSFPLSPAGMRGGGEIMEVMDCALSSEDGTTNDDELSCAESWASALIVELAHLRKGEGNLSINIDTSLQDCLEESQSGNSGDVLMTIDSSNEKTENSKEEGGERETISKAVLKKIIEAISVLGHAAIRESLLSEDEGTSTELRLVADGLKDGYNIENLSEVVISELLCKLGHLLNEHCCVSSCVPANVMKGNMDASGSEILETDNLRANIEPTTSVSDEFGGVMENIDLTRPSSQEKIDMAENRAAQETDADPGSSKLGAEGENGVHSVIDQKCECDLRDLSINEDLRDLSINENMSTPLRDLTLQMKCLQQEVERLSADRDELAAKLAHSQVELDEQQSRIATLDAESLLLASEKANLAQQLSQAALRSHDHLTEASASLEIPRQQQVTSEKAHPHVLCQDSEDTAESMPSDAGRIAIEGSQVETEADQKSLARQRKENEIASAKAQLAECQRTILELGNQLRTMSSAGGHVAEEPSFDSSLESAASTDAMNSRQTSVTKGEAFHGSDRLGPRSGGCRRSFQAGYVRTRGGRLVSTEQCWGSSGDMSAVCGDNALPGRYFLTPRNSYGATCPQSPLYEYVSDRPAYVYSPPDTALSSPSASPGRFNSQLKGPSVCSNVLKMTTTAFPGAVLPSPPAPSPSPAKKASRIARLFSRAKN